MSADARGAAPAADDTTVLAEGRVDLRKTMMVYRLAQAVVWGIPNILCKLLLGQRVEVDDSVFNEKLLRESLGSAGG